MCRGTYHPKVPATPPKASLWIVVVTVQSKRRQVKSAIDRVIVYGVDAIEIVWKVENPFQTRENNDKAAARRACGCDGFPPAGREGTCHEGVRGGNERL